MSVLDCYQIGDLFYDRDVHDSFWIVLDKWEEKTKGTKEYFIRMSRMGDGTTCDYSEDMVHSCFRRAY